MFKHLKSALAAGYRRAMLVWSKEARRFGRDVLVVLVAHKIASLLSMIPFGVMLVSVARRFIMA
jgi:hypothetical protein